MLFLGHHDTVISRDVHSAKCNSDTTPELHSGA